MSARAVFLGAAAVVLVVACEARLPIGGLPAASRSDAGIDLHPDAGAPGDAICAGGPLLDVIILLDNSSSMEARMLALLRRLSSDLPRVMTARGIDYRVVLVSRYGAYGTHLGDTYSPVCISAPLSGADCTAAARTPLVNHPPTFFHFSAHIDSVNGLCRLLEVWDRPDEIPAGERGWTPLFPAGLAGALRPAAWKAILVISDDEAGCTRGGFALTEGDQPVVAARRFAEALTALSPGHFGGIASPRFTVFSLVGVTTEGASVLPPSAPLGTRVCDGADKAGLLYQGLSVATGGARQSICQLTDVDPLFEAMAEVAAPACP